MVQSVDIKQYGTKMLYSSLGRNNIPAWYLSISKNARIKDNTLTKRRWYKTIIEAELDEFNQWITFNKSLFFCAEHKLYKVDLTDNTYIEIWALDESDMYNFINYWNYIIILTWVGKPFVYNGNALFQLWNESYQPAYLTSWNSPTKVVATWAAVNNWEFAITIDWVARTITWLNFTWVATMDEVCSIIQAWIRAVTWWIETVKFNDKNLFVISSWDNTTASAITVTSTVAVPAWTDISWAGGTSFLDSDVWATWEVITDKVNIDAPNVNPIIGDTFTWFTFLVGNTNDTKNVLYISRPITLDNPERAYDWTWDNSEQITFDTNILWLRSTMNQLFIFTENKIEYIWKDSLQTIWDNPTLITTPVWDGWKLNNYRCAVSAGDKILYLTKTNSINTLNFVPWTVDPWIGTLTDQPAFKITQYLKNLDEDQSWAFGYFDDSNKTAHRFLKTINSLYNDTILIFDLQNNAWSTDTNKYFNDVVVVDWKIYAWDALSCNIIQDWIWLNDNYRAIEFEIRDTDISLGTLKEKMFQWRETSGWLNKLTNLEFETIIDDQPSSLNYISWLDYYTEALVEPLPWEIAWTTLWWTAIGWLQGGADDSELIQFDKTLDHSYIYKRGKRIKRRISENSYWSDFYLDLYTIFADVTGNVALNDKF